MIKLHKNIKFSNIQFSDPETLNGEDYHRKRLPLMVSIPDNISSQVDLQSLLEAGMNLLRFNVSHQTEDDRIILLDNLKKAAVECCRKFHVNDWPVATCIELKTTMTKTGILEWGGEIKLIEGSYVILTRDIKFCNKCNAKRIFVDNFTDDIKVGDVICIGSDETEIVCKEIINSKTLKCVVTEGGSLKSLINVCVKGSTISTPKLAPSDYGRINFAMENQVDVIQLNHVVGGQPIRMIKEMIGKNEKQPVFLVGICTQDDLENIDDILKESDAILLSREVLPLHLEKRFKHRFNNIQKWVAAKCQQAGKPLFLSGEVFYQALKTGKIGIVELADVTNCVLDGFTGLVLTNCIEIESTLKVIYQLSSLCVDIEPYTLVNSISWNIIDQIQVPLNAAEATAMSCATVANQVLAKVIIVPTTTGRSVLALYRMRPHCVILAVCSSPHVARRLHLYKCVIPIQFIESDYMENDDKKIQFAVDVGLHMSFIKNGDTYVTLQKGSDSTNYCDTICVMTVTVDTKQFIQICADVIEQEKELSPLNMKREQKKSRVALNFS